MDQSKKSDSKLCELSGVNLGQLAEALDQIEDEKEFTKAYSSIKTGLEILAKQGLISSRVPQQWKECKNQIILERKLKMFKTVILKRQGYGDIQLRLGRHYESKWVTGDMKISGNIAGPNLPFEVNVWLDGDGKYKVISIEWALWRGSKPLDHRPAEYLHITRGYWPGETEHPAPTPAQAETIRRWHNNPSSRPFSTMSGPNKALLEWAGIDGEQEPLQDEDTTDPTIHSIEGELDLPLIKREMKGTEWAAEIQIMLHGNMTRVWAYVVNGNIIFCDTHHNGSGFENESEPSIDLLRKNSAVAAEHDKQAILALRLNATIKPELFKWLNVEPRRSYNGPDNASGMSVLDSDGRSGPHSAFKNRFGQVLSIFGENPTAGCASSGPYVLVSAVVDGYWYLAGRTVNAKVGTDFTIIGEMQIRKFLQKNLGKFAVSVIRHMDRINAFLVPA